MSRTMFTADEIVKIRTAKAWRVDPADVPEGGIVALAGTIFTIVPRTGDYGRYPVIILDAADGITYAIHAFHQLLFSQLQEMKAHPGMEVLFTYGGKREKNKADVKTGVKGQYHDWTVVPADGAEMETLDLDSFGTEDAPF